MGRGHWHCHCLALTGHHLDHLAILLTDEPLEEITTKHKLSKVCFPATYRGTGEPVLIFGAINQLGDATINRHMPGNLTSIELID